MNDDGRSAWPQQDEAGPSPFGLGERDIVLLQGPDHVGAQNGEQRRRNSDKPIAQRRQREMSQIAQRIGRQTARSR